MDLNFCISTLQAFDRVKVWSKNNAGLAENSGEKKPFFRCSDLFKKICGV